MKKIFTLLVALCGMAASAWAQAPKWAEKARRAVVSVVSYDQQGNLLRTGNGFFIAADGTLLTDYTTLKGAHKASVITADGVILPISLVLGANDMYDVIKVQATLPAKAKIAVLSPATTPAAVGEPTYLLPYSTQKAKSIPQGSVTATDTINGAGQLYYTVALPITEKQASCPLMNAKGEVLGLSQLATAADSATLSYAVDVRYAAALEVTALSFNDRHLHAMGIRKALPADEDQALAYLLMSTPMLSPRQYVSLLGQFVAQHPNSPDGHRLMGQAFLRQGQEDAARQCLNKAKELGSEEAAKMIDRLDGKLVDEEEGASEETAEQQEQE